MNTINLLDEIHLQIPRTNEAQPELGQRRLVKELGISLGRAHYCIKEVVDKGLVKMDSFSHNQKKLEYA